MTLNTSLIKLLLGIILLLLKSTLVAALPYPADTEWNNSKAYYTVPNPNWPADPSRNIDETYFEAWRPYVTSNGTRIRGMSELPAPPMNPEAGVNLDPDLVAKGYVSVVDFGADPTGVADSTEAIQKAIDFSRNYAMVCFFPEGTYTVSGTLKAWTLLQVAPDWANYSFFREDFYVPVLVGSAAGNSRPKIRLAPGTYPTYQEDKRNFVVEFRKIAPPSSADFVDELGATRKTYELVPTRLSKTERERFTENTPDHIGAVFRGIDIEIAENNAGASGLRMTTAETSGLSDVDITFLDEGHVGLQGPPGGGSSTQNLKITGGRVGLDTTGWDYKTDSWTGDSTGVQPTPVLTGLTLINQTELAIKSQVRGTLVLVGLHVETELNAPVIQCRYFWFGQPFGSTVSIVDSKIIYNTSSHVGNVVVGRRLDNEDKNKSFYLDNVYVYNAESLYETYDGHLPTDTFAASPGKWHHVKRLAYERDPRDRTYDTNPTDGDGIKDATLITRERVYIDGTVHGDYLYEAKPLADGETPPSDITTRHIYSSFPHFEAAGVKNVKDYGAVGDDVADDTAAIQAAIDAAEADGTNIVFFPRGYFKISDTLNLYANTKLIGINRQWSAITSSQADGVFGGAASRSDYAEGIPMIQTVNSTTADTVIAYLGIRNGFPVKDHNGWWVNGSYNPTNSNAVPLSEGVVETYSLHWQAGGTSIVRECMFNPRREFNFQFNLYDEFTYQAAVNIHPQIKISNHGGGRWYGYHFHGYQPNGPDGNQLYIKNATSPIHFYHLHSQHTTAQNLIRIEDSEYISIYGMKTEHHKTLVKASNTSNIRIFGLGGIGTPAPGKEHFNFVDNSDFLIATLGDEITEGENSINGSGWAVMYFTNIAQYEPIRDFQSGTEYNAALGERPILYIRDNPHAGYPDGHSVYDVTFNAGANGSVDKSGTAQVAKGASTYTVTATPSSGAYEFSGWSGDYTGTENPLYIHDVQGDMTITANFDLYDGDPVLTITSPSNGDSLFEGESIMLSATAIDAEDGDISASAIWTSSIDGIITGGDTLSAGLHQLTYSVTDSGNQTVSEIIYVTAIADPIVVTDLTGTSPAENLPWTQTRITNPNTTFDGIVLGAGESPRTKDDVLYFRHGTSTGGTPSVLEDSIAEDKYFGFTLTPANGYELNLDGATFEFKYLRDNVSDAQDFALTTSVGGFTTGAVVDTASLTTTNSTSFETLSFSISGAQYDGLTGAIEFRIYIYNSTWGRELDFKDFALYGGTVIDPSANNFSSWISGYTVGDSTESGDSDADGIENLVEYALNLDPSQNATPQGSNSVNGLPTLSISGTDLVMTYRKDPSKTDISYTVETSTDMSSWINTGITDSKVSDDGSIEVREARAPIGSVRFMRLKITN